MTTTRYVIYRHGGNAANQSMTQTMPIGIYSGDGATARERRMHACQQAQDEHTVYANQWLGAIPASRVRLYEYESARDYQDTNAGRREQYA